MPRRKQVVDQKPVDTLIDELKKDKDYFKLSPTYTRGIFGKLRRAIFARCKHLDPKELNRELQTKLFKYIVEDRKISRDAVVELHVAPNERKMLLVIYEPVDRDIV